MSAPRIDQINVVLGDVEGAAEFLTKLGVDVRTVAPEWAAHHRPIPTATSVHGGHDVEEPTFGIDFDSTAHAEHWGGLPQTFRGVVINLRVDERDEVDQLHEHAVSIGGRSLKAPYDAFWGARYATVEGPGPLIVGMMSVPDPAKRSAPPDPNSLG